MLKYKQIWHRIKPTRWLIKLNLTRLKDKAYATTISDSESSTSDLEESYDEEGNFSAFMTVAHVESLENLNLLV